MELEPLGLQQVPGPEHDRDGKLDEDHGPLAPAVGLARGQRGREEAGEPDPVCEFAQQHGFCVPDQAFAVTCHG